ncbi:MAG: tetratricopeptide repeat protein [Nanobdellota archaeon]
MVKYSDYIMGLSDFGSKSGRDLEFILLRSGKRGVKETSAFERLALEEEHVSFDPSVYENVKSILDKAGKSRILNEVLSKERVNYNALKEAAIRINGIFREEGLSFGEGGLMGKKMESGKANCSSYTTLYNSVFEIFGLSPAVSVVPGHIFPRLLTERDHINIESTRGSLLSDSTYKRKYGVHEESIRQGVYLNSLDIGQASFDWYIDLGNHMNLKGRYEEALRLYADGLTMHSKTPDLYNNKALSLKNLSSRSGDKGLLLKAVEDYDKAISLDPYTDAFHFNKAIALEDLGEKYEAIRAYDRAISLNPSKEKAYMNKSLVLHDLGKISEARECLSNIRNH